jgi:hypothetical protein
MPFRSLRPILLVFSILLVVAFLWLTPFFLLTSAPRNLRTFKLYSLAVIRNPLSLEKALTKYINGSKQEPVSVFRTNNTDYDFKKLDTGSSWNFSESYVVAKVLEIVKDKSLLQVQIMLPTKQDFSNVPKYVNIGCPFGETRVALRENRVVTDEKIDLFTNVAVNDLVLAYCSDSLCHTFKTCALIKMGTE